MLSTTLYRPTRAAYTGIVPHQAWRQSRCALLEAASAGPTTLALLGEAGTGKSWLLRHLEISLRKHGQAVTFVRQGDLPWQLARGTILLIDEASRLGADALALLAAQRTTLVILADLPKFAEALAQQSPPPRIMRLFPLEPDQVADFVSDWLRLAEREPTAITEAGIAALADHSGGTPRLITHLLNAAFAFGTNSAPIGEAAIDEVATLRWNDVTAIQSEPSAAPDKRPMPPLPIAGRRPRPQRARRAVAAATFAALAAAALLTLRNAEGPHPGEMAAHREAVTPAKWALELEVASVPPPPPALAAPLAVTTAAAPDPAPAIAPSLATRLEPPLSRSALTLAEATPPSLIRAPVSPASHSELSEAAPPALRPAQAEVLATYRSAPENAGPGLILIARRGDTLRELYANLYRGVEPPPFEVVVAANPRPVIPGAFVVFPAPIGGWPSP